MQEEPSFLGAHTCVPSILNNSHSLSALYGNTKLPPYAICTGHGQRVKDCLKYLENGVLLKNFAVSRVEIAVGLYKGTPIVVFEHQVGPSPVEVYCREVLSNELMTNHFNLHSYNNTYFKSDAKYVIRLGTTLGINNKTSSASDIHVNVGDINICNKQVGISGVDFQAITSNLNPLNYNTDVNKAIKYLKKYGYQVNIDVNNEIWPIIEFDQEIKRILIKCTSTNLKLLLSKNNINNNKVVSLNNVSKDSLYAEESCNEFYKLREIYNVATSEMETATMLRLSKDLYARYNNKIRVGATLLMIGVFPGSSFAHDQLTNKKDLDNIQWISTLDTLHEISLKHIYRDSIKQTLIYSQPALEIVTNPFLVGNDLYKLSVQSSTDFVKWLNTSQLELRAPFVCLSILRGGRYYGLYEAWNNYYDTRDNQILLSEIRASRNVDSNGNWTAKIWFDESISSISEIESCNNLLRANTIIIGDTIATASTLKYVLKWFIDLKYKNNTSCNKNKIKIIIWSICGSWIAKYNLYNFYISELLPLNISIEIVLANAGYTLNQINGTDLSLNSSEILPKSKEYIENKIGKYFIKNMKCAVWDWGMRFNDIQNHLTELNEYFDKFKPYNLPKHIRNHLESNQSIGPIMNTKTHNKRKNRIFLPPQSNSNKQKKQYNNDIDIDLASETTTFISQSVSDNNNKIA